MAQPEIVKDIDARVKIPGDTMTGNLTAPTFIGTLDGNASSANKLNTSAGSPRQPVYFDSSGQPILAANDYVFYDEVSGTIPSDNSSLFVLKTGDTMTGNLKVPNLNIANDICRGFIYGETNSLNFRGGNPTTEKYTNLKIAEDGVYINNQKIYYPGNKPTPADIGAYSKTETDTLLSSKMSNDLGQAGTNLLEWASAQTSGGAFVINPTVTTAGVPVVTWYAGLLEVNFAGRKMTITRSSGGAPLTYVNVTSAGVWQGWQQLANTSMVCNPNLLDNWYFGNPVNQRGQTEYAGEVYTIDRWIAQWTGEGVTRIEDGCISIYRAVHNAHICQRIIGDFGGKTVTLSILVKGNCSIRIDECDSGWAFKSYVAQYNTVSMNDYTLSTVTGVVPQGCKNLIVELASAQGVKSQLKAAKLEFGDQQTLAHQENGVWVLNEIPDYGEQLRRCRRYFRKNIWSVATKNSGDYCAIPYDATDMRTLPACTIEKLCYIGHTNRDPGSSDVMRAESIFGSILLYANLPILNSNYPGYTSCGIVFTLSADL